MILDSIRKLGTVTYVDIDGAININNGKLNINIWRNKEFIYIAVSDIVEGRRTRAVYLVINDGVYQYDGTWRAKKDIFTDFGTRRGK